MRAEAEERVTLVLELRQVRTGCLRNTYTGQVRAAELLAFFDSALVFFPHRHWILLLQMKSLSIRCIRPTVSVEGEFPTVGCWYSVVHLL